MHFKPYPCTYTQLAEDLLCPVGPEGASIGGMGPLLTSAATSSHSQQGRLWGARPVSVPSEGASWPLGLGSKSSNKNNVSTGAQASSGGGEVSQRPGVSGVGGVADVCRGLLAVLPPSSAADPCVVAFEQQQAWVRLLRGCLELYPRCVCLSVSCVCLHRS